MIAVAATGVDVVDLDYCRQNDITVSNIPHYTQHSVPEHVFMLILALRRNLIAYHTAVQAGAWPKSLDLPSMNGFSHSGHFRRFDPGDHRLR